MTPIRPTIAPFLLAILVLPSAAGCKLAIEHGLAEPEANEVMSALERSGIAVGKTLDEGSDPRTFGIAVAQSEAARALEILRAQGLPRARARGFSEVYGKPGLIPTQTEERARFLDALTGELETTLQTVDGVVDARVHLVLEERDPLASDDKPRVPASGAVLLKVRPGAPPLGEAQIQKLIAGSVPGLRPEQVSVVFAPAPEPPAASGDLVAVGPFRVAPGSRGPLLVSLLAGMAVLGLLAGLLLVTARKLAAAPQRTAE